MGGFSEQLAVNGLNNLFIPIFNIGFGLDSVLIGWAISIPRFFDMISDPIVGNLSDNCRSRFGRRKPFILSGSILMALVFALTYMASPTWGSWSLFGYSVLSCIIFYLMYTLYQVPYMALGLELSTDYDGRVDIQKYRMIFSATAGFTIPWLYKLCITSGLHIRETLSHAALTWYQQPFRLVEALAANPGVKDEVIGIRYVVWLIAGAIVLMSLPSILFTKENITSARQSKITLLKSAGLVVKNRAFRLQCLMVFLVITGIYFVGPLMTYMNIFYICGGNKLQASTWTGIYGMTTGLASLAGSFIIPQLVKRFDKKKVLLSGLTLSSIALMSTWITVNPIFPAVQVVSSLMTGLGLSTCWLLNGAFIADICDEDELMNGLRREGMFSAVLGFMIKMSFTLIALLLGYLLRFIGYQAGADTMPPDTIFRLRLFLALFPPGCLIAGCLIFSHYPLTREYVGRIQTALSNKKPVECR